MKKIKKNKKRNEFSKLLKNNSTSSSSDISKAEKYLTNGDYMNALLIYKKLIENGSKNPNYFSRVAEINLTLSINLEETIEFLKKALLISPNHPTALHSMGLCLRSKGLFKEAVTSFKNSIKFNPNFPEAFFNLALTFKNLNDNENAILYYNKALEIKPSLLPALNNLGNIYSEIKNYNLALEIFKKALELKPDFDIAHNNMGIIYNELGKSDLAIFHYKKSLEINSKSFEAYNNLGNVQKNIGNLKQAKVCYESALELNPDFIDAKHNFATLLMAMEKYEESKVLYEEVIDKNPNFYQAFSNLGSLFRRLGMINEAFKFNKKSIEIYSNNQEALNNLGLLFIDLNQIDKAITYFERAAEIKASDKIFNNLGLSLQRKSKFQESLKYYNLSLNINPNNYKTFSNLGNCHLENKDYIESINAYDSALKLNSNDFFSTIQKLSAERLICKWGSKAKSIKIEDFELVKDQFINPRPIMYLYDNPLLELIIARRYYEKNYIRETKNLTYTKKTKIRIGYFSADFVTHAATILIVRLFELYDSNKFEIYAYSFGDNEDDAYTERIKKGSNIFKDVKFKSDIEIVDLARNDEIDIAIDLMGYTKNSRPGIFSMRVAPVQISYLGFTGTMGNKNIDYIIADKILIKEKDKEFYDEKIIYLKDSAISFDDTLKISKFEKNRMENKLPETGFIFACFNNSYKISCEEFDIWMSLLKKVDNSFLWLYATNEKSKENLLKEANLRDIKSSQLIFAEKMPLRGHFERHCSADLFLDTFNHNAGCTAALALNAGLPILTLHGKTYHSRMSSSLLKYIDIPELITYSKEEYFNMALKLSSNFDFYNEIKNKLRTTLRKEKIFNSKLFVEDFEKIYSSIIK